MLHCGLDMAVCLDRCDGSRFRDRYVFCIAIEGGAAAEHEAVAAMGSAWPPAGSDFHSLSHSSSELAAPQTLQLLSGWRN